MYWNSTYPIRIAVLLLVALPVPARAESADEQYAVAARHYSQGRWQLAVEEFQSFLDRFSDHQRAPTARFFLAESLVQLERYAEARERFERFLEQNPAHRLARQALFRIGEVAYLSGQYAEARRDLERFHEQYPQHALNAYALPYLGEMAWADGDAARAQQLYSKSLRGFPEGDLADQCRFGLARALQMLGEAPAAERLYQLLVQDRQSALADEAQLHLGILYYQQRQYEQAEPTLQALANERPESPLQIHARYWLGVTQLAQHAWPAAAHTLTRAAAERADHPLAPAIAFSAGEALRQSGDGEAARKHYERVIQNWPDSRWAADSLQARIQLAFDSGEERAVEPLAGQFDQQFPASSLRPLVRQTFGRWLLQQRRYAEATEVFEQLLADKPAGAEASGEAQEAQEAQTADDAPRQGRRGAPEMLSQDANWYYLGLGRLGSERYADALAALERVRAVEAPPPLVDGLRVARASALVALQHYAKALDPLQAYLRSQPDGPDAAQCRAQLIVSLAQLDRLDQAQQVYQELAHQHADHPLYLPTTLYLAEAVYGQEHYEQARQLFTRLAHENNPPQYVTKGLAGLAWTQLKTEGSAAQSAETLQQLLEQFPDSPLAPEAALLRAQALEKLQQHATALATYLLVADQYPASPQAPQALLAAAQLHDRLNQKLEAAALFQRLHQQHPEFPQQDAVLYQWAWTLLDLNRAEQADALFVQLADQYRDSTYWADAMYRLAEQATQAKDYQRAGPLLDELLQAECEPEVRSHAFYLRGQLAANRQHWADVVAPMQQLLDEFPESPLRLPAEYWIAEAHYRLADYEQAGRQFARLEQQTRQLEETWLAMVPLRQAQILAQQNQWAQAYELAVGIAERFPEFRQQYEVDYLLGRCLASEARFDEARTAYERVIRSAAGGRTETAAMAQWMIGETYFHQKRYGEAIKAYHRVESLFGYPRWQAGALLQAGKCHERLGQGKEALKLYAQVLKEFPDSSFVEEASQRLRAVQQAGM